MNDELRERIEREAEKHALLNAVKHESDADVGAIMGYNAEVEKVDRAMDALEAVLE